MLERRHLLGFAIGAVVLPGAAFAQAAPSASVRLNEPGPENQAMARRAGMWDVTETLWSRPGAAPITTTGLVAERRVIGSLLQEFLRPASDPSGSDIRRIDYVTFKRVEGRWNYVSMDMRAPVGIMPAWSIDRGGDSRIDLTFAPLTIPGSGPDVSGQMLLMTQTISYGDPDRDVKDQFFMLADGTGTKWLAHQYAYTRRS